MPIIFKHALSLPLQQPLPLLSLVLVLFCTVPGRIQAQPDTLVSTAVNISKDTVQSSKHPQRFRGLLIGAGVTYGASLVALDRLWYKDFPREGFRFFNDNAEWKQVDKVGHAYSTFHLSKTGSIALRWAGLSQRKADLWGSVMGMGVMVPIEIFDGFSAEYGASVGDLVANTGGAALFLGQQLLWREIRIHPKFSFRQSSYAELRPNTLGNNFSEALLKDYNGQTYWLSFDLYRFLGKDNLFPKWLNLAVGYGAEGMVYANDDVNAARGFSAQRQYYLSIDFDFSHLKYRSNFLKGLLYFINLVHLPAPALAYESQDGFRFHWLKF